MHYTLIANSVDPDQVEERTIDGDRYLVAKDVPFIRPMELAGGYVPEQSVANSTLAWDEQPLTINHPKNLPDRPWYDPDYDGFYIAANASDEVRRRKVIGHAENPTRNGDGSVSADLAHNADRLEAIANGEAVSREDADAASALLDALEDGESFDVSSQYFPQPLPSGTYDGEYREEAEAIANADSIAILPNKDGVCSLEDGCGFQPQQATANAEMVRAPVANASDDPTGASSSGRDTSANAVNYALTDIGPDDVDEWTDDEWDGSDAIASLPNPSEDNDAGDLLDATHAVHPTDEESRDAKINWKLPFRTAPDAPVNTRALVAIDAALSGGRGGVEGLGQNVADDVSEWVNEMLEEAPDDLFGSTEDGEPTSNALSKMRDWFASTLGLTASNETMGAESPVDGSGEKGGYGVIRPSARGSSDPADMPGSTMERDKLINEITANSNIKRESLEGMGDQCLQSTHEHVVANEEGDGGEEEDDETTSGSGQTLADMTIDELADGLEQQGFVTEGDVSEAVANAQQQSEKEERVERIIANSAEYDSEDKETLMETPEGVLEDIEAGLSSNGTLPGSTGAADRATANASGGDDLDEYSDGSIGGDL
ncbi:hypothetical protein [Halovenus marina]|uniref:hypothetical protein n=1 Tax=Halovenus marina TaxID=3396621 RepID=UPI003F558C8E